MLLSCCMLKWCQLLSVDVFHQTTRSLWVRHQWARQNIKVRLSVRVAIVDGDTLFLFPDESPATTVPGTTQPCGKRQKVTSFCVRVTKRAFSRKPRRWKIDTHLLHFGCHPIIFFLVLYFSFFSPRTEDSGHGTGNGWERVSVDEGEERARNEELAGDSFWSPRLHKSVGERQKQNTRNRERERGELCAPRSSPGGLRCKSIAPHPLRCHQWWSILTFTYHFMTFFYMPSGGRLQ